MATLPLPPVTFRQRLDRIKGLVELTDTAPDIPKDPAVNVLIGRLTKKAQPLLHELLEDIIPLNRDALYGGMGKPGAQKFDAEARSRSAEDDLDGLVKEAELQVDLHEWIERVRSALA